MSYTENSRATTSSRWMAGSVTAPRVAQACAQRKTLFRTCQPATRSPPSARGAPNSHSGSGIEIEPPSSWKFSIRAIIVLAVTAVPVLGAAGPRLPPPPGGGPPRRARESGGVGGGGSAPVGPLPGGQPPLVDL